ncbi:hypothetical protein L1887_14507 [Cichorium endivia]|nr:hypothetical protein L1887_14507 [Cichorium endivia]
MSTSNHNLNSESSFSSLNASNPLFIAPSDNPHYVLVSNIFNGFGFTAWKRSMIISLSAKNKVGFIDGSISQPTLTDPTYPDWYRANSMVISWILNSLHQSIAESVLFLQTAKEIWNELNESVSTAHSIILQEERQRGIHTSSALSPDIVAMNVTSDNNKSYSKKSLTCNHCKKPGHIKSQCYRLHGFPADFKFTKIKREDQKSTLQNAISTPTVTSNPHNGISQEQYQSLMQLLNQSGLSATGASCSNVTIVDGAMDKEGKKFSFKSFVSNVYKSSSVLEERFSWIVDSGASDHMCSNKSFFTSLIKLNQPHWIGFPDGHNTTVSFYGDVQLHDLVTLRDVLTLIRRVSLLLGFLDQGLTIYTFFTIVQYRTNLSFSFSVFSIPIHKSFTSMSNSSVLLWHRRFGHLPLIKLQQLSLVPSNSSISLDPCIVCAQSKQHRLPFTNRITHSNAIFDLIHIDVWGPYKHATHDGHKFFVTIVDDFSRYTWVTLITNKGSALFVIKNFVKLIQTQFHKIVKVIRSDNAYEVGSSQEGIQFFASEGILHQKSVPYVPQQNGIVERKHKHILEVARALYFQSGLGKSYWGECVRTAVHLINRMPSTVLNNQTPYKTLYQTDADTSTLKAFGCLCFVSTNVVGRDKFMERAHPCIFIGYSPRQKAFKVLNLVNKTIFVTRDINFFEDHFPLLNSSSYPKPTDHINSFLPTNSTDHHHESNSTTPNPPSDLLPTPSHSSSPSTNSSNSPPPPPLIAPRRTTRLSNPPPHLQDYVCNNAQSHHSNFICTHTITENCICDSSYLLNSHSHSNNVYLVQSQSHIPEPAFYHQAKDISCWKEAMSKELDALTSNGTWDIVKLPKGKKPISCKWVYKVKYRADGSVERHKANLVAKRFTQRAGIDYHDTFSPVVKFSTIRCIVAVAVKRNWTIQQLDVNNAFLQRDLHEEVYMKPPSGFNVSSPLLVCRLKKSLYGLKQTSPQWYAKLSSALSIMGYCRSSNDHSLFIKKINGSLVIVAVYVDDILLTQDNLEEIAQLKQFLDDTFKIKDLGRLHFFLGLEFNYIDHGIVIHQQKYIRELLDVYSLTNSKQVSTPLVSKSTFFSKQIPLLDDPSVYRQLVGKLNFLIHTRPDLAFTVQFLSQFNEQPTTDHYDAAIHVLKYLKGTLLQGLYFNDSSTFTLEAFCDSDGAACPLTRRSVSGYFILFEAEYRSMRRVCSELAWLNRLLYELQVPGLTPIPLRCDNLAAIYIAKNPVFHERTKHIEIDCHFVREKLQS